MQTSEASASRALPRRSHKKSKTGCRTCRIRKVKCDERRPLCVKCERHFRNLIACDFDDHDPVLDPRLPAVPQENEPESSTKTAPPRTPNRRVGKLGRDAEMLKLPAVVGAGRIDPFETRPASEQPAPRVDALIGHYLSDFAYRAFPLYGNKSLIGEWWPFVRNSQLLFHVILLLTALDRERLQLQASSIPTRQLFDQCLQLLNEHVKGPDTSINDHTLTSIAALAAMESGRGNIRATEIHTEGLRRAVELRGGLDAIRKTSPMVANFVFWCAMVTINETSFLPLTYGDAVDDSAWLHDPDTATLLTHDGREANLLDYGVDVATANMLHRVQRLSRLYANSVEFEAPQQAFEMLTGLCSALEQLLRMSRSPSDDSSIPGLSQSCRLAGCLHLFAPQSGYFPDPTLMLHTLVHEIKASLGIMIRAIGTKSHLLLWLLAVGGITAHSMPERSWFVGHLVVVVTDMQIDTWEEMRQHLLRLAFHDNFCDISFHALWDEVRQNQDAFGMLARAEG